MAAPPEKTINDLNGRWFMNRELSDDPEPALALQGISWLTRKAIGLASVTIDIDQRQGLPRPPSTSTDPVALIDITQILTGGLRGTVERRCLDQEWREHEDWLFGKVRGHSRFVNADELDDEFLKRFWIEGEAEAVAPGAKTHVYSYVESMTAGWTAVQMWGFQMIEGERRFARNLAMSKDDERVEFRLVYDYMGATPAA